MVSIETQLKTCADCGTAKTPLWRDGLAGPKSLCNPCGIRSRKKATELLGLNKQGKKTKKSSAFGNKKNQNKRNKNCTSSSGDGSNKTNVKKKLSPQQRPKSKFTRWKKLGEVEKTSFLLMSLSYGSVYS
ncbi:hypothetical protein P3S67_005186 [Capsicum chacoense]